ncbi:VOC family protein [Altererythrobacter indicus]|uniref:VOC family protein n=1 Tax=Altericroceibacterium indicum TaxID=374177 RepID=A0A845ADB2_9SPHN|nr:VOC family protein [Altericroceibacterium indicum]MXP26775.1 VOC family protein [Altericroceibacterium indicum]
MPAPTVQLAFFKLNVSDMDAMLQFYTKAFGFAVTMSFDEPEFLEHIMGLPGLETGPNLLLVAYKDGRTITLGNGHGPVGFTVTDMDSAFAAAMDAGASVVLEPFAMGSARVAMLKDPEGHEIELVQFG